MSIRSLRRNGLGDGLRLNPHQGLLVRRVQGANPISRVLLHTTLYLHRGDPVILPDYHCGEDNLVEGRGHVMVGRTCNEVPLKGHNGCTAGLRREFGELVGPRSQAGGEA